MCVGNFEKKEFVLKLYKNRKDHKKSEYMKLVEGNK